MTMTTVLALVPPDEAHAGDLIGYTRDGRPILLPGGGARDGAIVVDDGDDEDPDADPDDELDEDDEPGDISQPSTPPARKPTYRELADSVRKLEEGNRRNNAELRRRRVLGEWMAKHDIDDLDSWLAERGIDRSTAELTGVVPAAASGPAPEAAQQKPAGPVIDEAEIERRIELGVAQRVAQGGERADLLEGLLRASAVENALSKLGFSGTFETALRVADLDSVAIDEDGNVTGATEAAESLKTEIPEWFRPKRNGAPVRTGAPDVDGGDKPAKKPTPPRWDQRVAERLRGGPS